jgi:endonuclease/exonuclease/phosphatase family metal-dependent hydrolase
MKRFTIPFLALLAGAACTGVRMPMAGDAISPPACRAVVDPQRRVAPALDWSTPADDHGAAQEACATVGPAVFRQAAPAAGGGSAGIAVVSWNVHVGGADVAAFVDELRSGRHTGGIRVRDFVLLLQETFRQGPLVPALLPPGASVPGRIEARMPDGRREDIVATAERLGLGLFYVPSMRNGSEAGERGEDRGNAILTTLPMADLAAVELPHGRQRRVAVGAVLHGEDRAGAPWTLRVVSAHLAASTGPRQLWLFSDALRERQAGRLREALAGGTPTVLGSDLNTWAGGTKEGAYELLQQEFPETIPTPGPTFRFGLTLDYLFYRLPPDWHAVSRALTDDFGSDHRPVVAWIAFAPSAVSTTAECGGIDTPSPAAITAPARAGSTMSMATCH